jgi:hypothetical protein
MASMVAFSEGGAEFARSWANGECVIDREQSCHEYFVAGGQDGSLARQSSAPEWLLASRSIIRRWDVARDWPASCQEGNYHAAFHNPRRTFLGLFSANQTTRQEPSNQRWTVG